jgi:hypothetical protein
VDLALGTAVETRDRRGNAATVFARAFVAVASQIDGLAHAAAGYSRELISSVK